MPHMGNSTKGLGFSSNQFITSGGTVWNTGVSGYEGVYFTSNGTFQVLNGTRDVEILVISGGSGGGGGAFMTYGYF